MAQPAELPMAAWAEARPLRDAEFRAFQALVYREAGIFLSDAKRALLVGRLSKRLRELEIKSFGEYHEYVTSGDGGELATMLDCICTNETHFFREPDHFRFLSERYLPELRALASAGAAPRRLRVWSAACSTGEEPYSLAMLFADALPASDGWDVRILGTDLSGRALAKAREGLWSIDRAREIPEPYLKRYMLRGTRSQEGRMKAGEAVRRLVELRRLNLNAPSYGDIGVFDLVFCRNVLIYFDGASRAGVVQRLLQHLGPASYLFLGHAETLTGVTDRLRSVAPTVYTWTSEARRGGAR